MNAQIGKMHGGSKMKGRRKAPAWLRTMLWTSSMRAATALRSMSGVSRSGYGPPHSWKMASEAPALSCAKRKNPDSDADMDVDGGDTLEQGKPQFTEADVIPCTGEEPGEAKEREALRGSPKWWSPQHPHHT